MTSVQLIFMKNSGSTTGDVAIV